MKRSVYWYIGIEYLGEKITNISSFLEKRAPHPCVVCAGTVESSRALPKERAAQFGLKEEDLGDKVQNYEPYCIN